MSNHSIVVSHEAFDYLCDAYGLTQMPIEGITIGMVTFLRIIHLPAPSISAAL